MIKRTIDQEDIIIVSKLANIAPQGIGKRRTN